jgi:HEAT repeat protein
MKSLAIFFTGIFLLFLMVYSGSAQPSNAGGREYSIYALSSPDSLPESIRNEGDDSVGSLGALLRDLKDPDFDKAYAAAEKLREHPENRAQVVAGLIDAIQTGEWSRCAGDMRDAIARLLRDLEAREAVVPLLELVRSGKSIEHECAE